MRKACNKIIYRKFPSTQVGMIGGRTDYAASVANFLAKGGKVTKLAEGHAEYAIKFYEFDSWRGLAAVDESAAMGDTDEGKTS